MSTSLEKEKNILNDSKSIEKSSFKFTFNKKAAPLVGSTSGQPGVDRAPDPGRCNQVAAERAEVAG